MALIASLFTALLWLLPIRSQQFNGPQFLVDYTGISELCVQALNTTLSACPPFLLTSASDNFRLPGDRLELLCQSECLDSLNTVRNKNIWKSYGDLAQADG